jgi:monoamine oxidase
MAARTFHDHGIKDFIIIEGRDELGGRLKSTSFAGKTVELGANWVQGTYSSNDPSRPANPIFKLVQKHEVRTQISNAYTDVSKFCQQSYTKALMYASQQRMTKQAQWITVMLSMPLRQIIRSSSFRQACFS